jgi:hypothetical protein
MTPAHLVNIQLPLGAIYSLRAYDIIRAALCPGPGSCCASLKRLCLAGGKPEDWNGYYNLTANSWTTDPCVNHKGQLCLAFPGLNADHADDESSTSYLVAKRGYVKFLSRALTNFTKMIKQAYSRHIQRSIDNGTELDFYIQPGMKQEVNAKGGLRKITMTMDDVVCLRKLIEHGKDWAPTIRMHGAAKVAELTGTAPNMLKVAQNTTIRNEYINLIVSKRDERNAAAGTETMKPYAEEIARFLRKWVPGVRDFVIADEVSWLMPTIRKTFGSLEFLRESRMAAE